MKINCLPLHMIIWVGVKDLVSVFNLVCGHWKVVIYLWEVCERWLRKVVYYYKPWIFFTGITSTMENFMICGLKKGQTYWLLEWNNSIYYFLTAANVWYSLTQSWYANFPQYCLAISGLIRTLWYGHKPLSRVWSELEDHHLTLQT